MSQVRAGSGKEARRPRKSQGNGKRNLAQIAHVVCSNTCALTLRGQLLRAGDLTRAEVESGQVEFGPDPFGNHVLVLLENPAQPVIFPEEYLSGAVTHCGVCGSPCAVPPNLSGKAGRGTPPTRELRTPTAAGEALRERVLSLTGLQLRSAAELLCFYVETVEPWPEDDEAPLTEIHQSWVVVQRGYEAIARRMEQSSAAAAEKDPPFS